MDVACNVCSTTMNFDGLTDFRDAFRISKRIKYRCPECFQVALKVKEHVEGREIFEDIMYGVIHG